MDADLRRFFLPSPVDVLLALNRLALEQQLTTDIVVSLGRVIAGVVLAMLIAVPTGLLIAVNRSVEAAAEPLTLALRYTPVTAFIPILMVRLGIGDAHKITVLTLGVLVQLLPAIVELARGVEQNYIDLARTYGLSDILTVRRVILPRILPGIVESVRAGMAIGWAYVLLVEFWGAEAGLGHRMWLTQRYKQPDATVACAIVTALVGLLCDYAVVRARRAAFSWESGRTLGSVQLVRM